VFDSKKGEQSLHRKSAILLCTLLIAATPAWSEDVAGKDWLRGTGILCRTKGSIEKHGRIIGYWFEMPLPGKFPRGDKKFYNYLYVFAYDRDEDKFSAYRANLAWNKEGAAYYIDGAFCVYQVMTIDDPSNFDPIEDIQIRKLIPYRGVFDIKYIEHENECEGGGKTPEQKRRCASFTNSEGKRP